MNTIQFFRRVEGPVDECVTVETDMSEEEIRLALEDGADPGDLGKVTEYLSELVDIYEAGPWEVE